MQVAQCPPVFHLIGHGGSGRRSPCLDLAYFQIRPVILHTASGIDCVGQASHATRRCPLMDIRQAFPNAFPRAVFLLRAAEINNCPKIALDFGSESRRGKGRIVVLCNPCRNTEAGPKDKQDWMIICFRGPKTVLFLIIGWYGGNYSQCSGNNYSGYGGNAWGDPACLNGRDAV